MPPIEKHSIFNYALLEPVGLGVAITPWNSPLLLAMSKLATALAAGCTLVKKPYEHASASLLEFTRLVEKAGSPPGLVNVVNGYGHEIGDALVSHPWVAKIAFMGGKVDCTHVVQEFDALWCGDKPT